MENLLARPALSDGPVAFSGRLNRAGLAAAGRSGEQDENATDPQAGQPGTKKLTEKYGDALLCIRFKYDRESRQRLKTVELIEEKADWTPPPPRYAAETIVPLRIDAFGLPSRTQAKAAGQGSRPRQQADGGIRRRSSGS